MVDMLGRFSRSLCLRQLAHSRCLLLNAVLSKGVAPPYEPDSRPQQRSTLIVRSSDSIAVVL